MFFDYRKDNNPVLKWGSDSKGLSPTGLVFGSHDERRERSYRDLLAFNKQSIAFYLEVLPYFYQYILDSRLPLESAYTFLDVGARSGAGANLYGEVFCDERWGYRIKLIVDTTDINDEWNEYQKSNFFISAYHNTNVFDMREKSYDIVYCSHTIEHLDEPIEFVRQLKKVAKYFAFISCPFNEINPIARHRCVGKDVIDACEPKMFATYFSVNRWRPDLECCVFAV
jgi:SAM-dependent methyltransferase